MKKIEELDKNFALASAFTRSDIKLYDVCEQPFTVYGLILPEYDGDCFRRMPQKIADTVNSGVSGLNVCTAGGRVRFATDSEYIGIHADFGEIRRLNHMPLTGTTGFDLYSETDGVQNYIFTFRPPVDVKDCYEGETLIKNPSMREYTINFPLYSSVKRLYIALDKGAAVKRCRDYRVKKPVLYYGSSITQGACASRPGNAYQSILSRRLDCDFVNLGFSGNARAEKEMAQYIAAQEMSVFVYDYDYNAPTPEYLGETHERFFKTIRAAQPDLPIVCVSRPNYYSNAEDSEKRRQIIMKTVENAKNAGDNNVYFADGKEFCTEFNAGDSITVDTCHPNDLGFMCMANKLENILKKIL